MPTPSPILNMVKTFHKIFIRKGLHDDFKTKLVIKIAENLKFRRPKWMWMGVSWYLSRVCRFYLNNRSILHFCEWEKGRGVSGSQNRSFFVDVITAWLHDLYFSSTLPLRWELQTHRDSFRQWDNQWLVKI